MAKAYKAPPAPRADSRLNPPLLLGVIIGLLLGIVISPAVALWLNRLSNPFVEKGKTVEPTPKIAPAQPPAPASAAKAAEEAAKAAKSAEEAKSAKAPPAKTSERPRFEFYQILPGDKEVSDKEAKAAAKAAAAPAKPGSSPSSPKPHSGEVYWLQAGGFSGEKEADNLKGKIAFSGLGGPVPAGNNSAKGALYRVFLRPYPSLA